MERNGSEVQITGQSDRWGKRSDGRRHAPGAGVADTVSASFLGGMAWHVIGRYGDGGPYRPE